MIKKFGIILIKASAVANLVVVLLLVVVVVQAILFQQRSFGYPVDCFICITFNEISEDITQEWGSTVFNLDDFSNTKNRQPT